MTLVAAIIGGGAGSRLWPMSRQTRPKPFFRLPDGETLIGKTYSRISHIDALDAVMTVTNRELLFLTRDVYGSFDQAQRQHTFLLEPMGRDTAAAVALASVQALRDFGDDAILLVVPADQVIQDESAFAEAVAKAMDLAITGQIVTFGIVPERPEPGFGYIEVDGDKVQRFVEKPDVATAQRYLEAGNYFWNSGIFCFTAHTMLAALAEHCPDVLEQVQNALSAASTGRLGSDQTIEIDADEFSKVRKISIDYAVMEKATNMSCVPVSCGWSDVGSWSAIAEMFPTDDDKNRAVGETVIEDSANCFVLSQDRLVGLAGVNDLLVVDTPDALLVAHRDKAQDVKKLYARLEAQQHDAVKLHRTAHRPWGTYTVLEEGKRFKIKRIEVKPGAKLSLQAHKHRAEHWVVVSGTAKVVNGDEELILNTNESTYIPLGNKHRLENPGETRLVMIEVQSGDYLGEDDIVRFDDIYGRD